MADYTLTAKLTADARDLIRGFDQASDAVQGAGKKIQSASKSIGAVGAKMSVGITLPLVAAGKAIIGTGMAFDDSMAKVSAVSGATGEDLQALRDTAKEMGATTRYSASEAADGLNFMAMAGWNTEQMVSGLPGVLSLAAASGADLATTSDIVTDALTAFGLEAKDSGKFADILAAASSKANTDVVMLGESFKYVAPLAGAMNYAAEDVSVALGLMANAGIKGSQAGTSLKTMLANLASPTSKMSGAMDDLGISLTNSDGSMKTLDEVMGDLRTSFADLDEVQQAQYASTIFGKEAMAGSLAIINASEDSYDGLSEAINNSEGAAATMAETMENTLGGKLRSIQSATEGVAIGFYEEMLPALEAVAEKVLEAVGFLGSMSGESKRLALMIAGIVGIVGPLLVGLSMFGFLIGGVVTAIGFMISPVGLVIAGLLALGATFGIAMYRSEEFRNVVMGVFEKIQEFVSSFISTVIPILQSMWDGAKAGAEGFASSIGGKLLTVFETVKSVIGTVIGVIGEFIMSIVGGFTEAGGSIQSLGALFLGFNPLLKIGMLVLSQFGPQIAAGFVEIASLIVPILTTLGTMLGQLAAAIIPMVMNVIATLIPVVIMLGTSILQIITAVLPVLLNIFMQLVPVVMSLVSTIIGLVTQLVPLVTTIIGAVVPVLMMLIDVILNIVQAVAPALIAIIGAVIAIFQAIIPIVISILTVIIGVMTGIISAITPIIAFVAGIITSIIAIIAPIVTFIAGVIASIFKAITPIIVFVTGVFNTVFSVISGIFNTIVQYIGSAIQSVSNTIAQVSGVVSGVFNGIWSKIASVMDRVKTKIQGVFDAIKTAWSGLKTFVSSVFTGIGDNMADLVNRVKGFVNGVIGGINSAIGLINKIPGVSIGKIPQLARGTDDWQGGLARINEGGRGELVNLPSGAQVIPHDISMKYAREAGQASARSFTGNSGSGDVHEGDVIVNIGNFENRTDRDLETLSHDLGWMTKRERGRLAYD
ncbi:phage tail tape measure protein [Planococcus sp. X10-3]|uniref:phage tail tape measure protein n=1 Tax=Planococcus sp. X10-3 TaxID=3061240 RepID=UPI003BB170CE